MIGDTTCEMEAIQLRRMMELSPDERVALGCEMFMAAREMAFASLPKGLSDAERKRQYYKLMYGEWLPVSVFDSRSGDEDF